MHRRSKNSWDMICKIFILRNQNTSRSLSLEHVSLCPVAKHTITLVDRVSEQEFFSDSQIGEVLMYSYIRHVISQKITLPDFQAINFTPSISPNFNSFSDKNTNKWVKMEKFATLTKILHCRRQWRQWQIPPLHKNKSRALHELLFSNFKSQLTVTCSATFRRNAG